MSNKVLRATIAIATAGAVYGLGKVAKAALQSAGGIERAELAAARFGPKAAKVFKALKAVREVSHGSFIAAARNIRSASRGSPVSARMYDHPVLPPIGKAHVPARSTMESFARLSAEAENIRAQSKAKMSVRRSMALALRLRAQEAAAAKEASRAIRHEDNIRLRHEALKQQIVRANIRLEMQRAQLENAASNRALSNIQTTIRGMSEIRSWYRMLFGTAKSTAASMRSARVTDLGIGDGMRHAGKAIAAVQTQARGFFNYWLPLIASMGAGVGLLSGAKGFGQRAVDLSVSRESAMITFDTLLGDKSKSADIIDRLTRFAVATPFQMEDVTQASRRLLRVTNEVGKNMDLVRLSANIASLTPGSSVEDVGRGVTQAATSGEFEILKGTYGIPLRASMFEKKPGEVGYSEDVINAIKAEFARQTGGRDLVTALSMTTAGLMSTVKDAIDTVLRQLGDSVVQAPTMKGALTAAITWLDSLGVAVKSVMADEVPTQSPLVNSVARVIGKVADMVSYTIDTLVSAGESFSAWFSTLDPTMQDGIVTAIFGSMGLGVVSAVAVPLLGVLLALWPVIEGIGVALLGMATSLAGFALGLALPTLGATLALAVASVYDFSSSLQDNLLAAFNAVAPYVRDFFNMMRDGLPVFAAQFIEPVLPALAGLRESFRGLLTSLWPILETFLVFINDGPRSQEVFYGLGSAVGSVVSGLIGMVTFAVDTVKWFVDSFSMSIRDIIYDVYSVVAAVADMFNPNKSLWTSISNFGAAISDLLTTPMRIFFVQVFHGIAQLSDKLGDFITTVLPTSMGGVGLGLKAISRGAMKLADSTSEGASKRWKHPDHAAMDGLSTRQIATPPNQPTVAVTVPLTLDGEKVAQSQAKIHMRSRAGGRGGDPMEPEEIGYVISGGRISAVGYNYAFKGG